MQDTINDNKKNLIENIFKNIGYVRKINEDEMHSFTALYGSGPAYIMYFIESFIGCENFDSISDDDKALLILQLLNSTSKLLLTTKDIGKLRSKVTSKGGTTESAIQKLEENNFSKILEEAIKSARKKSIDLSK
jgi:pyrroline-5-carboxylate reductase